LYGNSGSINLDNGSCSLLIAVSNRVYRD